MSFSNGVGRFELNGGTLSVYPAQHYPDEQSARQVVDLFLRAWEIEADLAGNLGQMRFNFTKADIVDRNPPPPGQSQLVMIAGAGTLSISGQVTARLTSSKYPSPPSSFAATPDVQLAHSRWMQHREGKEPLQAMAYFVLTVVEKAAPRRVAASTLGIEFDVLSKIGELSSTKGGASSARKVPDGGTFVELSAEEGNWLEKATRSVIRRLGEHAAAAGALPIITMADLPPLP